MFEHIKLNMHLNDMVGFAYEFDDDYTKDGKIMMQVYIVTLKNNEYSFIEYKTYKFFSFEMLYAIADDIDTYFPEEKNHVIHFATAKMVGEAIRMKQPKIFISHSSQDKEQAKKLVTLFEQMGLNEDQIFCSSVPGYDIGIDGDIFEGIKQQFSESELHLVYLLSGHYYDSAVSLNEMGAAWIVQAKYTLILLPGFNFEQIKGVVNKNQIGIKLDNSRDEVKDKLNQLYDNIVEEFKLQKKKQIIWEGKRDNFIDEINR